MDEFHTCITENDIDAMTKSALGIVVAPFITFAVMYAAKGLKKDTSMSENFVYSVRRMQDTLMASSQLNYARTADQTMKPEPQVSAEQSRKEAENLNNLYTQIKDQERASSVTKTEAA